MENRIKLVSFFIIMQTSLVCFCQIPANAIKVMPKANKVGDTVELFNYYSNGTSRKYLLLKIDKKGRYKYKDLDVWRGKSWVTYDKYSRIKTYKYKFNEGLWGGAGKGIELLCYGVDGSIKVLLHIGSHKNSKGEICLSDSLVKNFRANQDSQSNLYCYAAYKKGRNVYLTDDWLLDKKELKNKIKNSVLEDANNLIEDFPFNLFILIPKH